MAVDFAIWAAKVALVLIGVLNLAGLLTWAERKQSAVLQDRIGANRADILGFRLWGLFHPLADAIKMLTKEDFIPAGGNRVIHFLAPAAALFPALIAFAVIPFGDRLLVGDRIIKLQVADLNVGLLYILAVTSMGVYGAALAGWSSYNKYSLLGGVRASAQMISYELVMGLALVSVIMAFGSVRLDEIARMQGEHWWGIVPRWGIFLQPFAFVLFLTAAIAETKRVPFDLPEAESEIVGYFIEYSGMKFGAFFFAEFISTVVIGGLVATLFFGGWQVPWLSPEGFRLPGGIGIPLPHLAVVLLQLASFSLKTTFFCWLMLQVRWTLPRFRYDQLMSLGWKSLLPLSLANLFVTALVVILV